MNDRNSIKLSVVAALTALTGSAQPGQTVTLDQAKTALDAKQKAAADAKVKVSTTTDAAALVLAKADYDNKFSAFVAENVRYKDLLEGNTLLDKAIDDCAVQLGEPVPAVSPAGMLSDKLANTKSSWFSRVF